MRHARMRQAYGRPDDYHRHEHDQGVQDSGQHPDGAHRVVHRCPIVCSLDEVQGQYVQTEVEPRDVPRHLLQPDLELPL